MTGLHDLWIAGCKGVTDLSPMSRLTGLKLLGCGGIGTEDHYALPRSCDMIVMAGL